MSQLNNFFVKSQQFHEKYLILAELFLHFFLGFFKQSTIYIPYKCKAKNEIFYLEMTKKTSVPALVFILWRLFYYYYTIYYYNYFWTLFCTKNMPDARPLVCPNSCARVCLLLLPPPPSQNNKQFHEIFVKYYRNIVHRFFCYSL